VRENGGNRVRRPDSGLKTTIRNNGKLGAPPYWKKEEPIRRHGSFE